ncbi:MAG: deoxyribonuclease IV [Candidatus Omnitrophica bacterium]|nr:deoxyribonuclease IV [Candidatus Omnitrophota bacterium]
MLLGVQVSISDKIYESIDKAKSLGCNTMQIFSRNPRQWRQGKLNTKDIEEFRKRVKDLKIFPVFVHISYLINLASPYNKLYRDSIKAYIEDIKESESLGVDYIVSHMGNHKKSGEDFGINRLIEALNIILDKTKDSNVKILLENTSGSGSWLGYKFEHQKEIIDKIENKNRIGICLDTCHAYSAGYDLAKEEGLEDILFQIDNLIGLNRLKLIHLNDSKDRLGSKKDRHEDIGKGKIGLEGFRRIINHKKLRDLPFILETPRKTNSDDIRNLNVIRNLRKGV